MIRWKPPFSSPEQVLVRHLDVREAELAGVGGVPAHLLELSGHLVAGHLSLQDEEGEAVVAALGAGLHRAGQEVGADAVGDERLRAVDDVAAGHLAGGVRIPATLEPASGSVIPSAPILSPRMPGTIQRWRCSSVPKLNTGGIAIVAWALRPAATPPEPPERDSSSIQTASWTAVPPWPPYLLGELEAEEPELAAASEQLPRELARLLPLVDVGGDLLADEPAHRLAQLLVLLGERRRRRAFAAVLDHGMAAHRTALRVASQQKY